MVARRPVTGVKSIFFITGTTSCPAPASPGIGPVPRAPCPVPRAPCPVLYNRAMADFDFSHYAEQSLSSLRNALIKAEEDADFEVEDSGGAIHVSFDDPPGRFVISPNSSVNQIWISALSTSFKLDWSPEKKDFVLNKTGEALKPLVGRLINQQLGADDVVLS